MAPRPSSESDQVERTVKRADLAMYSAKRSGQPFAIHGRHGRIVGADDPF